MKQDLDTIMQQLPLYVLGLLESEEARIIEALARTNAVVAAEIAALTVFLRRKDYRALSREYSGETIDLPSRLECRVCRKSQ